MTLRALRGRTWPIELALAVAALGLGLPSLIGMVTGFAPQDWRTPLALQLRGDFGLRTTVYLSGLLVAFAVIDVIGLARGQSLLDRGKTGSSESLPPQSGPEGSGRSAPIGDSSVPASSPGFPEPTGPVSLTEPFYGFLPASVQRRLARQTGYNALLYTKVSILLSAVIGVLLAGSWEPQGPSEPFMPQAAIRIVLGLYLMAESLHRYLRFARKEPAGTLVGAVLHAAVAPMLQDR